MPIGPLTLSLLALAVPVTLAVVGLVAPRRAGLASDAALGLGALFTAGTWLLGGAGATLGVRVDAATCTMLLLVGALAAVIVRYSRTCLDGDPRLGDYLRWLLLTLSAITTLVITANLLVLAVAWGVASVTLHQLLTFYADRPAALVAAHKKFLVSRLADTCLGVALWLLYAQIGTFDLDAIAAFVAAAPTLPVTLEAGAVLLVLAVALRTAQLPFHGWITQVMEAPTPVSALLHAGVVNVGGFVLIRLAPWLAQAGAAQVLLVSIGIVSATVGALVMTTRVSVKVALAWSTIAQLGLMLVQCGLGLWSLALLHLVAHSLYKAHAFLSAGSAVDAWRVKALVAKRPPASPARVATATLAATGLAAAALAVVPTAGPVDVVFGLLLALSLVPLLTARAPIAGRALASVGVVALYLGGHALAAHVLPPAHGTASVVGWWITGLGLFALFALKTALQLSGRLAGALHPWLFAGFFLDELFTRWTFRLWPPSLDAPPVVRPPAPLPGPLEVRS